MKAKSRGQRRKKFQQPAQGKGTPGMTRLLCAQAPHTLVLLSRSCRRRAGRFTACPGSPAFCTAAADRRVMMIASEPASQRALGGKGSLKIRDLVGEGAQEAMKPLLADQSMRN
jgi:hypothetical protein